MGEIVSAYRDLKVSGIFVVSILESMGAFKSFAEITLGDNGITSPQVGQWYDASIVLKVFEDMSRRFGSSVLFQIGRRVFELAPVPPEVNSVESAMVAFCTEYPKHHRGPQIGFISWTKIGDRSGTMVVHNPYPCEWNRGAITTAGERYKRPGQLVRVVHDDTKPCRNNGGDECTYNVRW